MRFDTSDRGADNDRVKIPIQKMDYSYNNDEAQNENEIVCGLQRIELNNSFYHDSILAQLRDIRSEPVSQIDDIDAGASDRSAQKIVEDADALDISDETDQTVQVVLGRHYDRTSKK